MGDHDAPSSPEEGPAPAGFRMARICDLRELESGVYWPQLEPHFLKPQFRQLRYQIMERAAGKLIQGDTVAARGASGIGELDVAYIADRLAATMSVTGSGIPDYCLTSLNRGSVEFVDPTRAQVRLAINESVGLVYRGVPGTKLSASGDHERLAVWIPASSLNQRLAALLNGPLTNDLAFEPTFEWATAPAQTLRRLLHVMVGELGSPEPFAGSSLAVRSFTDLLLYALLQTVPHNYTERLAQPGSAAVPTSVRQAENYILTHLEEPIALHDVAVAAGCSVRSLQLGFRRFRDTTPLQAIRDARLNAARQALRVGRTGETVTDLALRFGFTNPGRFASLYRAAFGEAPLETLRRSPLR